MGGFPSIPAGVFRNLEQYDHGIKSAGVETTKRLMTRSDCYACNKVPEQLTDDHVVARSRGGSDGPENWAPSCRRCNSSKGKRNLNEWTAVKGGNLNTLDLDVLVIYVRNMFKLLEAEGSLDTPASGLVRFLLGMFAASLPTKGHTDAFDAVRAASLLQRELVPVVIK